MSVLALLLHAPSMVVGALVLAGALPWLRARLDGVAAPPFFHQVHSWQRLLRKAPVVSQSPSPLLLATPPVCLALTLAAALLVPSFALGMASAPLADLVVIVGLLGLCRVLRALAAIDGGTAPAGLAAVATMRSAPVAVPALLLAVFTVVLLAGTSNLDAAAAALRDAPALPLLMTAAGLAIAAVAMVSEADPSEAEVSGWHLALAEAAMALRRVVWLSLVACLVPAGIAPAGSGLVGWLVGLAAWALKLAVLGGLCAAAGPALRREGGLLPAAGAALLLALLAVLFLFAGQTFA